MSDLSFFKWSGVFFFCEGGLESNDSFLLWQTTQGCKAEMKTPNEITVYFSEITDAVATCSLFRQLIWSRPLLSLVHWGTFRRRRRVEVKRKWRKRSVGIRRLFSKWKKHLWAELNHFPMRSNNNVRQRGGHADPDLGGGGWRWRGRGAIGAFGSGGTLLM